jgi:hypothetical protein
MGQRSLPPFHDWLESEATKLEEENMPEPDNSVESEDRVLGTLTDYQISVLNVLRKFVDNVSAYKNELVERAGEIENLKDRNKVHLDILINRAELLGKFFWDSVSNRFADHPKMLDNPESSLAIREGYKVELVEPEEPEVVRHEICIGFIDSEEIPDHVRRKIIEDIIG